MYAAAVSSVFESKVRDPNYVCPFTSGKYEYITPQANERDIKGRLSFNDVRSPAFLRGVNEMLWYSENNQPDAEPVTRNSLLLLRKLTEDDWNVFSAGLHHTCRVATSLLPRLVQSHGIDANLLTALTSSCLNLLSEAAEYSLWLLKRPNKMNDTEEANVQQLMDLLRVLICHHAPACLQTYTGGYFPAICCLTLADDATKYNACMLANFLVAESLKHMQHTASSSNGTSASVHSRQDNMPNSSSNTMYSGNNNMNSHSSNMYNSGQRTQPASGGVDGGQVRDCLHRHLPLLVRTLQKAVLRSSSKQAWSGIYLYLEAVVQLWGVEEFQEQLVLAGVVDMAWDVNKYSKKTGFSTPVTASAKRFIAVLRKNGHKRKTTMDAIKDMLTSMANKKGHGKSEGHADVQ